MTLRPPIKDRLVSPIDASSVARIRAGVVARERRSSRARWAVAAAGVAALALVVALVGRTPSSNGPLTYGGQGLNAMEVETPRTFSLDDGSRIALGAGTRLVPRTNDGRELVLDLERGQIELDVRPGTGRRWMVEARWATVEVVGTRFVVARDDVSVEVSVQRGKVVVRGEQVLGRERHLIAGQTLRVLAPKLSPVLAPTELETPEAGGDARRAEETACEADCVSELAPRAPVQWRPRPRPAPPTVDEVAPLLASADAARAEGRPREAAEHLAAILREHPDDRRAALAAFTLARLELDVLDRPDAALDALERALALGLPAAIVVDAHARRVEALGRSGRVEDARAAAARFQADHPESPRLPEVQRWLQHASP